MRLSTCLTLWAALLVFALPAAAQPSHPLPPKPAAAAAAEDALAAGLIVAFHPHRAEAASSAATLGALSARAAVPLVKGRHMARDVVVYGFARPLPLRQAQQAAARIAAEPGIRYAVPDRIMRTQQLQVISDPLWFAQWHYATPSAVPGGIDVSQAWNVTRGHSDIVVAVIDTGIRGGHPDLQGRLLPGYDFVSENTAWTDAYGLPSTWVAADGDGRDADPTDPGTYLTAEDIAALPLPLRAVIGATPRDSTWHGTHVAGTVVANINGLGGVGIDRAARLVPVRVLGKAGIGLSSDIIEGMLWAAGFEVPGVPVNATPAHVLNLSLGGRGACDAAYQEAIDAIVASGRHVVVAAGNDAAEVSMPANCRGVIAVAAHAYDGDNAWYSNVGPEVAVSAPGGGCGFQSWNALLKTCSTRSDGVISTVNLGKTAATVDDYGTLAGTSMAAPHVSGVVALMLSLSPALSPAEVRSVLQSTARPHPPGTTCAANSFCGAGLLDAAEALAHVRDNRPSVSLGADRVSPPNTELTLTSQVATASGRGVAAYQWRQLSGPALALTDATQASLRFVTPATGRYGFELAVTDTAGYRALGTVNVRVNSAPVMRPIADQVRTVGQYLVLPVQATDADGDDVAYVVTSVPPGASFNTLTNSLVWSPAAPASGTFTVYATDGLANSEPVSAIITFDADPGNRDGGGGAWPLWGLIALAAATSLRRRTPADASR